MRLPKTANGVMQKLHETKDVLGAMAWLCVCMWDYACAFGLLWYQGCYQLHLGLFCRWRDVLLTPYGVTDPTARYNQAFDTISKWTLERMAWLDGAFQGVAAAGNKIVAFGSPPAVATAG